MELHQYIKNNKGICSSEQNSGDQLRYSSSRSPGGWLTTIMHTSEDIFVVPCYGEGIVYLPIAASLVLEEEGGVIECCQFDKSPVIISVEAPFGCLSAEG